MTGPTINLLGVDAALIHRGLAAGAVHTVVMALNSKLRPHTPFAFSVQDGLLIVSDKTTQDTVLRAGHNPEGLVLIERQRNGTEERVLDQHDTMVIGHMMLELAMGVHGEDVNRSLDVAWQKHVSPLLDLRHTPNIDISMRKSL